jgi:hypothetical protein
MSAILAWLAFLRQSIEGYDPQLVITLTRGRCTATVLGASQTICSWSNLLRPFTGGRERVRSIEVGPAAGGIAVKNPFAARFVNYSKHGPE